MYDPKGHWPGSRPSSGRPCLSLPLGSLSVSPISSLAQEAPFSHTLDWCPYAIFWNAPSSPMKKEHSLCFLAPGGWPGRCHSSRLGWWAAENGVALCPEKGLLFFLFLSHETDPSNGPPLGSEDTLRMPHHYYLKKATSGSYGLFWACLGRRDPTGWKGWAPGSLGEVGQLHMRFLFCILKCQDFPRLFMIGRRRQSYFIFLLLSFSLFSLPSPFTLLSPITPALVIELRAFVPYKIQGLTSPD